MVEEQSKAPKPKEEFISQLKVKMISASFCNEPQNEVENALTIRNLNQDEV